MPCHPTKSSFSVTFTRKASRLPTPRWSYSLTPLCTQPSTKTLLPQLLGCLSQYNVLLEPGPPSMVSLYNPGNADSQWALKDSGTTPESKPHLIFSWVTETHRGKVGLISHKILSVGDKSILVSLRPWR